MVANQNTAMQSHARVVIVGSRIGALSTLYHPPQEDWTDVVLPERNKLTSGTTWHSAAQCSSVAFNQLLLLPRDHTIKLYKELADYPTYPINYHYATVGLRLLTQSTHVDEVHHILSVAKGVRSGLRPTRRGRGKTTQFLLETDGVLGALWNGLDGDIDPVQLGQALAARSQGGRYLINKAYVKVR